MPCRGQLWSEEKTNRLRELWGAVPTKEIAEALGTTKGAIIGKAHRLGLEQLVIGRKKKDAPAVEQITCRVRKSCQPMPELRLVKNQPPPLELSIWDLGPGDCRWPDGDPRTPDFFFCGNPAIFNRPYCPHHMEIAYSCQQRVSAAVRSSTVIELPNMLGSNSIRREKRATARS